MAIYQLWLSSCSPTPKERALMSVFTLDKDHLTHRPAEALTQPFARRCQHIAR
jgi:hypothetical protein